MAAGVRVRPAAAKDGPKLVALSSALGYPTDLERLSARLDRLCASAQHAVFVAESSSGVIGWIHVFAAERVESEPFAELGGLVVAPDLQRRGVGSRLVAAAETWARERGLCSLRVRSRVEREGAHAFYLGLGFELRKSQAVFVRPLDG